MLPPEIEKAVGEYKNPSTRILVMVLILAIMAVTAGLVKLAARDNDKSDRELAKSEIREDNCEKNNALLRAENNELRKDKVDDLRKLLVFQDSFKNVLKAILKNK